MAFLEKVIKVDQTPTITAAAYTAVKALGGLLTFAGLCDGGIAELLGIRIIDKANQKSAIDLLLFDRTFTPTADAATIAISAGDSANLLGRISIVAGDYTTIGTMAEATKSPALPLPLIAAVDNNIYGQLVCRGTPTYASTADLLVRVYARVKRGDW